MKKDKNRIIVITPPNLILNFRNAKIVFDREEVNLDEVIHLHMELKNYLNTFKNVNL